MHICEVRDVIIDISARGICRIESIRSSFRGNGNSWSYGTLLQAAKIGSQSWAVSVRSSRTGWILSS